MWYSHIYQVSYQLGAQLASGSICWPVGARIEASCLLCDSTKFASVCPDCDWCYMLSNYRREKQVSLLCMCMFVVCLCLCVCIYNVYTFYPDLHHLVLRRSALRPRSYVPVFDRPGADRTGECTTWNFETSPVLTGRLNDEVRCDQAVVRAQ